MDDEILLAGDQEPVPGEDVLTTSELTLRGFIQSTYRASEQTTKELEEIDILVKQSSAEVERLTQRNTRVANYLNQLHTNFDTIPREDIKEGYEALINAQQRLFSMRGQLEKLQSDQRNLRRLAQMQRRLLAVTEGIADLPEAKQRGPDPVNIIRVIQTEEAARRVLVRRMHDGPASSLSNFILQAEICERYFEIDPDKSREELQNLKKSAGNTFATVKNFIFDLRPMMLDDLGVVPTLRRYVESVGEKYEVKVDLNVTGPTNRLEEHVEVTVFRAVQELLNNARIHGQASEIQINMDQDDERLLIVVDDNGGGFNVSETLKTGDSRQTIGLPTLQDRVAMLNGELDIQSTLGQGTRIEFTIPVFNVVEIGLPIS
jgi:two-component system sensor histidine kinase DegS